MQQLLSGYRVVDFSHVLAGPIATNFLCLLGADVVKIESSSGDTMRNYGSRQSSNGMGSSFVSVNSGKRSIVLDLKEDTHRDVARRLIAQADVVVENFRPGVIDRLGLGYSACREIKPDIVFCSISGFGQSGPLKFNPAIDQIIQSMSGLMTLSGEPGSSPMRIGFPVVDSYSGLLAAFAIMSALLQRERTGEGQCIDLAMFDAAMVMMISVLGPYLVDGSKPEKQGNRGYSMSPTADTFPTAKGSITLGVIRDEQFRPLCAALARPDLLADPRFANRKSRLEHSDALQDEVKKSLSAHTADEWEKILNDAGVAAGAVRELPDAIALSHFQARGLKFPVKVPGSSREQSEILSAGFRFSQDPPPAADRRPPLLGEHTKQILEELGYSPDAIEVITAGKKH